MASKESGSHKVRTKKAVKDRRTHPYMPERKILDLVDVFLFLCDARIPGTSARLAGPFLTPERRVYVLAKPDLADPELTKRWILYFQDTRVPAFAVNCSTGDGLEPLLSTLRHRKDALNERRPEGVTERPLRVMLFGPPNVGKSSLANRLLGTQKAPFGAKPGLTRGSHWLRGSGFVEVLDIPGVVETAEVKGEARLKLAAVWALPDSAYDPGDLAVWIVRKIGGEALGSDEGAPIKHIEEFGRQRGFLRQGGVVDLDRSCQALIHEFREGRLGRITLEEPLVRVSKDSAPTLSKGDV